ncbi:coagulation factor XIII A chain-like, partial [Plectropomus leopardus]|uniref:coagulation factor XIII A chain-like n=1 Tax=Plectropomus leopardus TaxID=160734 RepID=UPI001C4D318B
VQLGQDVNLQVDFHNQGEYPKTIQAHLAATVIFYTGVRANNLKDLNFTITVPANQVKSEMLKITAQEYVPLLASQQCLRFVVTGTADDQSVSAIKVLELQAPSLTLTVSGQPQVGKETFVTVSFTNNFTFPLLDVSLSMEGPGVMSDRSHEYSRIEPQASISWKESFTPRLEGNRCLVAVMDCSNLRQ